MKKNIMKLLRDVPSSLLLIVGFGLTVFITLVSCGLINDIMNSKKKSMNDNCNYFYMNIYHTNRIIEKDVDMVYSYVKEDAQNINFDDIYEVMKKYSVDFYGKAFVYIGEGQEQQKLATSIYYFDEKISFPLKRGYIDWSDNNSVIIGETIEAFTITKNKEKYLYVNGEYYKVTGILQNNNSGNYDSSIYFVCSNNESSIAKAIGKEIEDKIMFGETCEITTYYKNTEKADNINFAKKELENNYELSIDVKSEPSEIITENEVMNHLYENLNKIFMPILFLFSISSCYSMTNLWVKVRRTDIAVKITYGYGKLQILKWIIKEFSILIGISLVISIIIRLLYLGMYNEFYILKENLIYDVAIIIGAIFITLFTTTLGAYKYSKEIIPAEVLKEL